MALTGTQATEGWAGETRDVTTGLTYLRARDYEPRTGRFLSTDTESPNGSLTQGFNPYHYTGNNPVTRTDPTGHNWMDQALQAVGQVSNIIVDMVFMMRDVMRNDDVHPIVRKFLGALLTFGIAMMSMLLQMLLFTVIGWATGATRTMIGSALYMSRLRVLGTQGKTILQCIKGGFCQRIGMFLARNGDCLIEGLQFATEIGMSGGPDMGSTIGRATFAADASFMAKECLDRTPGGGNGFTHGNGSSSLDPPFHDFSRANLREVKEVGSQGELAAGIAKNHKRIKSKTGTAKYRIPDGLDETQGIIAEVKNVSTLSYSSQIRDFELFAQEQGYQFHLWVRASTVVSAPLQKAIDDGRIIRRNLP